MYLDWNTALIEQLDWGREASTASRTAGSGEYVCEFAYPEPEVAPVTTIAWRLGHTIVGVFAERNASHFGGPPADPHTWDFAGTAAQALAQLDDAYSGWIKGVRGMGADGLLRDLYR